jgi:hypothetical protein
MTALALQPTLDPKEPSFGGTGLFWPDLRRNRILQGPSPFPRAISQAGGQISASAQPALVDLAKEWVATILKTGPASRSQMSVFDMPPLNLGRVLRPMAEWDDLLQEMLDDTRF